MSIEFTGIAEGPQASASSSQKQKTGFQNLGSPEDPLRGPVLVQDRASHDYFWSHGEVGMFRGRDMIAELTMVDTSGGVTTAMQRMSRQTGRGLDVFGGVNRNAFSVSVPSSEYLTESGSVTFRVRYQDGSSEDVTFHMAPPDAGKHGDAVRKLAGADVVDREAVESVLTAILQDNLPGSGQSERVRVGRGTGPGIPERDSEPVVAGGPSASSPSGAAGIQASLAIRDLETVALTSQEQWFRSYHLLRVQEEQLPGLG